MIGLEFIIELTLFDFSSTVLDCWLQAWENRIAGLANNECLTYLV